ncbi:TlpA disulfide reductase family protein [Corynebacterium pygosceleis]|uniref:TlpA disulfide reductase family protein n=1 Tax=Corynebacterium pygosceleis TaxID=2800406 RepID=A0A9Q4CA11_9CORY|nr:TlpA disulfide reductase family protein [Corynebacterium pygosceleis]MCK7637446.1 TlpA family protein disulfide reductase [Corynebacterium pygosceleis]MCK7674633.1 TlpA family protein disulfide reductase [Corynebacterium pygosceleis]MCL0119778.1 TlpA family protein disulfide reductase [Corynebacterium pygosceleis]MCX7445025.1 TlpA disulfide reductase family protein [Corynebacterium pygosceleis]MCX7468225.1 TlpA disulfide reductase family protein [Corynebacterium pygosceleis]
MLHRVSHALTAVLVATVTLVTGCSTGGDGDAPAATVETFQFASPGGALEILYPEDERRPVTPFSGESLKEPGETISLSDYDGQVVVLNAWGQWCGPCRTESDDLQLVHETIREHGGTVLGINVRDYTPEISRDFMEDNGLTYPSLYDPPFKTAAALGGVPASVIPTTIVLDKQHRPAAVFLREITADDILAVTGPLLEE